MKHLLHLLFTSTLVSTLSLTALGAVQRDLSFLPSAKEAGALDRGLPYDAEVEWIANTSTSYLNFGTANQYDKIECKIASNGVIGQRSMIMGAGSSGERYIEVTSQGYWGTQHSGTEVCNVGEFVVLTASPNSILIDGRLTYSGFRAFNAQDPFLICRTYGYGIESKVSVSYVKLYKNNALVVDAKAVVKNNIGYMYDRVSGRLFGNSGTGAFTVGPITHVVNRKVAMGKKDVNAARYIGVEAVASYWEANPRIVGSTLYGLGKLPFSFNPGNSTWEFCVGYTPDDGDYRSLFDVYGRGSTNTPFMCWYSFAGISKLIHCKNSFRFIDMNITKTAAGSPAILQCSFTGTKYRFRTYQNGEWSAYVETSSSVSCDDGQNNILYLGYYTNQGWHFKGTFDLSKSYMKIGDELIWEGAKGAYDNVNR